MKKYILLTFCIFSFDAIGQNQLSIPDRWRPFFYLVSSDYVNALKTDDANEFDYNLYVNPLSNDVLHNVASYMVLGKLEREKGNYSKALEHLKNGRALIEKEENKLKFAIGYQSDIVNDVSSFTFFDVYDELGYLYLDLGRVEKAKSYFDQSIEMRKKYFTKRHILISTPYIGLGMISEYNKDYYQSIEMYDQAIRIMLSSNTTSISPRLLYGRVYSHMATVQTEVGLHSKALRNAKMALRYTTLSRYEYFAFHKSGDYLQKVKIENLIARIYLAKNDLNNAEKWLEKANRTYVEYFSIQLNPYTDLLKTKAQILWAKGELRDSQYNLELMMDNHINHIKQNFNSLTQKEKEDFYKKVNEDLNLYFNLSFQTYLHNNDQDILKAIINRRIITKGFLLNDQNKIRNAILNTHDESLKEKYAQLRTLRERFAHQIYEDPLGNNTLEFRQELDKLERDISEKTNLLSLEKNYNYSDIVKAIQEDQLAIEVIRYNDKDDKVNYAFIIINGNGLEPELQITSFIQSDELRIMKFYQNSMQFELKDNTSFSALWQPVDEIIDDPTVIYFSPDGIYHQINVNTLINIKKGNFVVDNYPLINITNLKDLVSNDSTTYNRTASLFGRPQYNYSSDVNLDHPVTNDTHRGIEMFEELGNFRKQHFPDLPGTAVEIENVSNTLDNYDWDISSFIGPNATELRIKELVNPGILHIATHGFFLSQSSTINPMIKSGLIFAGVNNDGGFTDDGVLTAYETTNLTLDNTWLVVLSACETGLGDIINGEGVYGLQRALSVAGAANLMMTLWKVDDAATKDLMTNFYKLLGEGQELEKAFFNSQRNLRSKYKHPKYWGSFILIKSGH